MASRKRRNEEKRYVILDDGTEREIVRADGKYFFTADSQFRKATHKFRVVKAPDAVAKEEPGHGE